MSGGGPPVRSRVGMVSSQCSRHGQISISVELIIHLREKILMKIVFFVFSNTMMNFRFSKQPGYCNKPSC